MTSPPATAPAAGGAPAFVDRPLLAVEDVRMVLNKVEVLRGVTLRAMPGTATCLCGGNGAGKTTLLRIAAGIFVPRGGTVRACGFDPVSQRAEFARHVGFVTAGNDGVYARLRVRQNLELWGAIAYLPRARRRAVIEQALDTYGLRDLADGRTDRLSLGQRQRIRLALGSLHDPDVLLLDEPHSSLDDDGLALLAGAIERHCAKGGAVVWAAPSPTHAPLPCDEVVTLERGLRKASP